MNEMQKNHKPLTGWEINLMKECCGEQKIRFMKNSQKYSQKMTGTVSGLFPVYPARKAFLFETGIENPVLVKMSETGYKLIAWPIEGKTKMSLQKGTLTLEVFFKQRQFKGLLQWQSFDPDTGKIILIGKNDTVLPTDEKTKWLVSIKEFDTFIKAKLISVVESLPEAPITTAEEEEIIQEDQKTPRQIIEEKVREFWSNPQTINFPNISEEQIKKETKDMNQNQKKEYFKFLFCDKLLPWEIFNFEDPDVSYDEIIKAYREKQLTFHQDHTGIDKFNKALNEAFYWMKIYLKLTTGKPIADIEMEAIARTSAGMIAAECPITTNIIAENSNKTEINKDDIEKFDIIKENNNDCIVCGRPRGKNKKYCTQKCRDKDQKSLKD